MTITVYGRVAPQGSKRHAGNGRMVEMSQHVKPWRDSVNWAAREAARGERIIGPVSAEMTFTLPRPISAKKNAVPSKQPDIDKLARSTCDALKMSGVIEDDSRVVDLRLRKVYPGQHPDALETPGAVIRIEAFQR